MQDKETTFPEETELNGEPHLTSSASSFIHLFMYLWHADNTEEIFINLNLRAI